MAKDWVRWHESYDIPESRLSQRVAVVRRHLRDALDRAPAGPIGIVSMCAGQGRDVIPVVADHERRDDVRAVLVELDPDNAAYAARSAAGLPVEVRCADASMTDVYTDAVPAEVVVACGIFGNIADDDIRQTVNELPHLCATSATVVWTRFPREDGLLDRIDGWFIDAGFDTIAVDVGSGFGVGAHRLVREPRPIRPGVRLFTFLDDPDPRRC
jgi:hypothetical protein